MATTGSDKDVAQGTEPDPPPPPSGGRRRRGVHRFGTTLMVVGALVIVYAGVILFWGDPITALYADWRQHELAHKFDDEWRNWQVDPAVAAAIQAHGQADARTRATELRVLRDDAARFSHEVKGGQPFGRLTIGRIGLSVVVVQGTDWLHDLSQGPGHYTNTHFPGQGTTVGDRRPPHDLRRVVPAHQRHQRTATASPCRCRTRRSTTASSTTRWCRTPTGDHPTAGLRAAGALGLPPALLLVAPLDRLRPRHVGDAQGRRHRLAGQLTAIRHAGSDPFWRGSPWPRQNEMPAKGV